MGSRYHPSSRGPDEGGRDDARGPDEGERDDAKARRKREAGLSFWTAQPVIPSLRGISRLFRKDGEKSAGTQNDNWRENNPLSPPSRHLRVIAPSRSPWKPWRGTALVLTVCTLAAAAGCATPRGVPHGADLVTEATVKSSFQSPTDGMLYIYRSPARGVRGQLHYSGPMLAGQTLVIDPAMNRATLDGEPLEVLLPGGDVLYQAYFRRDPSVRRAVSSAMTAGSAATRESHDASAMREQRRAEPERGAGGIE
jgi:hypothetical protein